MDPRRGLDDVAEMDLWTRLCDVEPEPELLEPCEGDWPEVPPAPEPVPPAVCEPPEALLVAPDMFLRDSEDPDRLPSLSTWKNQTQIQIQIPLRIGFSLGFDIVFRSSTQYGKSGHFRTFQSSKVGVEICQKLIVNEKSNRIFRLLFDYNSINRISRLLFE